MEITGNVCRCQAVLPSQSYYSKEKILLDRTFRGINSFDCLLETCSFYKKAIKKDIRENKVYMICAAYIISGIMVEIENYFSKTAKWLNVINIFILCCLCL